MSVPGYGGGRHGGLVDAGHAATCSRIQSDRVRDV